MSKVELKKVTKTKKKNKPSNVIEEIKDDLGNNIAIQSVHNSEGGQLLIEALISDSFGAIDRLCIEVATMSHIEMVSLVCKIKERLDLIKVMTGAKARKEVLEDLLVEEITKQEENPPSVEG